MTTHLLARVDADGVRGTGHAHRVLSIAEAWIRRRGKVTVATEALPEALANRFREAGCSVVPAQFDFGSQARAASPDWVLLDGYHLGPALQETLLRQRLRVLVVDDMGQTGTCAGAAVLDTGPQASPATYPNCARDDLLLGPSYVPLRQEYQAHKDWTREIPNSARHLLVTFGGNAPPRLVRSALAAARGLPAIRTRLVLGAAQDDRQALSAEAAAAGVECLQDVRDMASHMRWADLALTAGGTTTWEASNMQLPRVALELAANQRQNLRFLQENGLGVVVPGGAEASAESIAAAIANVASDARLRRAMAETGRRLVDGRGGDRIVHWLKSRLVSLRPVTPADRAILLEWANDPVARSASFTSDPIRPAEHDRWFDARMRDPASALWIGTDPRGHALGVVRVQDGTIPAISVNAAPAARGAGWGLGLIAQGTRTWLAGATGRHRLYAFIRPGNGPSIAAFQEAGYRPDGQTDQNGQVALRFVFAQGGLT